MQIKQNTVVQFHYQLKETGGDILEITDRAEPMLYLHGHKNILPGLEEAMEGKQAGDQLCVDLEAAQAYGQREEGLIERVPIKYLQGAKKWKPGMPAWVETEHGLRPVTVVKVGKFNVDVDLNHPLAGKDLTFDITIESVREATPDEIAHGHAHGVGGHQH